MLDYYETERYVFTHGWLPCPHDDAGYGFDAGWRKAGPEEWQKARWYNGMDAARSSREGKLWSAAIGIVPTGHANYEHKGSEFGPDADFSPFYGPGIIILDNTYYVELLFLTESPMRCSFLSHILTPFFLILQQKMKVDAFSVSTFILPGAVCIRRPVVFLSQNSAAN